MMRGLNPEPGPLAAVWQMLHGWGLGQKVRVWQFARGHWSHNMLILNPFMDRYLMAPHLQTLTTIAKSRGQGSPVGS